MRACLCWELSTTTRLGRRAAPSRFQVVKGQVSKSRERIRQFIATFLSAACVCASALIPTNRPCFPIGAVFVLSVVWEFPERFNAIQQPSQARKVIEKLVLE